MTRPVLSAGLSKLTRRLGHELSSHESYGSGDLINELWAIVRAAIRGSVRLRRGPWRGLVLVEPGVILSGRRSIRLGRNIRVRHAAVISARGGRVDLGDSCSVGRFTIIETSSGLRHPGGAVVIGARSSLADFCYLGGAGGIRIGSGVLIGQNVSFHSENHEFANPETDIRAQGVTRQGIDVEDDCWIGAGARILDGVRLAQGTVVGAGAVVTNSTSAGQVVGGVPARVIRDRSGDV